MMIKTLRIALLSLTLAPAAALAQPGPPTPQAPAFDASSYILMDYHSGQIIAERTPDERVDPASITKLMTAYITFSELAAGNITEDDLVTVSKKAWKAIGSRMFVEVGTQVRIGDLLRGMIIQSGNDASIALAEHLAGGEDSFAGWMNQHAQRMGLANTHYMNATGLSGPEHYSSARDIALLARALITEFPEHYALYSQKEFSYGGISQANRNKLLWRDATVDGMKTGYTEAAGYCLVSSAQREGMRLISVVLGTPSGSARIRSSEALLNYGFRFFETLEVGGDGEKLAQARIWKAGEAEVPLGTVGPLYVTIPRGQQKNLELKPVFDTRLVAPVTAGEPLGEMQLLLRGETIRSVPLVALKDMPLGSLWQRLRDEIWLLVKR